ncbi:ATP-binding protein [Macrococcus brunensis]|uniref:ATP-binding protein n=1 Tax=Macrococcus brunensis TaxID=198483 RepID=UPI001EF10F0A|nr:AAA family ATPase [Macrococcus brunensis]ULG71449.1 AAA family ATPase [Macrococcus brunensis]
MKIKGLEIYGYGRLEGQQFNLNRSFTQIYGENETGKSTMQTFIHSLLFGFARTDKPLYVPRFTNQYGGHMVMDDEGSELYIERIYRDGAEQVTILYNNSPKDIEWLHQKFNFMTDAAYDKIFSFDVLGLQQVHQLTEDKLQDYLMQAGVFGSTEFSSLETNLIKEKLRLLAPDHSEGELSDHITEILNLQLQIRDEEVKLERYEQLSAEQFELKQKMDDIKMHISQLTKLQQMKQKEMSFHANAKEWKQLELQLNIEPLVFPDHGIERYEGLKKQLQAAKRDIALREEKIEQLKRENSAIELLDGSDFEQAEKLLQEEPQIKVHQKNRDALERDIAEKEATLERLQHDIGWQEYHDIKIDEALKDHLIYALSDKEQLNLKTAQLQREISQLSREEELNASKLADITPHIVTDDLFRTGIQLSEQRLELSQKTELYHKLESEQQRAAEIEEQKRRKLNLIYLLGGVVGLATAAYLFYLQFYIPASILLLIPIIMIVLFVQNKPVENNQNHIMQDEISHLESSIQNMQSLLDDQFDLERQRNLRDKQLRILDEKAALSRKKEQLQQLLTEEETALKKVNDTLNRTKNMLKLKLSYEDSLLPDAFRTIYRLQQTYQQLMQLKTSMASEQQQLDSFSSKVNAFSLVSNDVPPSVVFTELGGLVKTEVRNRNEQQRVTEQLQLSEKELSTLQDGFKEMDAELKQLFKEAGVKEESDYYRQFEAFTEYYQNLNRHHQLSQQLEEENFTYEMSTKLSEQTSEDLRIMEGRITDQLKEYAGELKEQEHELYQIEQMMKTMEEDTTLSELNHRYAIERNIVNELALDYSALHYIEVLIDAHRQRIKGERIPNIIRKASEIFTLLTEGRYIDVIYHDALLVKHKNGQIYHPTELSQSTKELLYITMRLSLVDHLRYLYPFPVIIDDAFVHFDKHRKDMILEYLMQQQANQYLYFTCNRSANIPAKNTIVLERHEKELKK